jgi:hypothetical protein
MSKRLDYDRVAQILVEAAFFGVGKTAEKYNISERTIQRYHKRMDEDSELSVIFQNKKEILAEKDWVDEAQITFEKWAIGTQSKLFNSDFIIPASELDKDEKLIYLIKENYMGLIKIGVATDVKNRFCMLQISCPQELELIGVFKTKAAYTVEKHLHHRFIDKHYRGEWFALTDDDIDTILNYNDGVYLAGLPIPERNRLEYFIDNNIVVTGQLSFLDDDND